MTGFAQGSLIPARFMLSDYIPAVPRLQCFSCMRYSHYPESLHPKCCSSTISKVVMYSSLHWVLITLGKREWRLEKTGLHLPFIPFHFSAFFSSPKRRHSHLATLKQLSWSKIVVCRGWSETTLLYQFRFLLGILLTFQKTVILMKTTQALNIKLTLFVKNAKGWRRNGKKKGRGTERESEGKFFPGCIGAYKNHIVYQAMLCLISQKSYSYYRAEKLQIFPPQQFLSQENKIKYVWHYWCKV